MITLILSSSLSPHLPSIWPIYIWPQATSLSLRITLQFSVTMFTVAASCNCLVYTLSLNTTQNETLPSLLSSCDRILPLLSLCCMTHFIRLLYRTVLAEIYITCFLHWVRIVSPLTAPVRVRRSDSDSRPLSPAPAPTMRWQQQPEPHCHSPSNTCPQNIKTNGFWHNKATLSPPPLLNNQLYDCKVWC